MLSRWTCALWVMALLATGAVPAGAQCAPANGNATWLVRLVNKYANPMDVSWAAARDSLRISSPAPGTAVVLVTKAATCKSANTAYRNAVTGNRATLSGQVHVVQSGTTYVVWDPSYRYATGANRTYMVFSSSWVLKRKFQ